MLGLCKLQLLIKILLPMILTEQRRDKDNKEFPKPEEIFKLRKNFESFKLVCNHLLPGIVGRKWVKENIDKMPMSKLFTQSDEAFLLLVMENNRDRWEDMIENKTATSKKPTKWSRGQGTGALKFNGWDEEGLASYNTYTKKVKKDREKRGRAFDEYYEKWVKENVKKKTKGKKKDENPENKVNVENDLDDLDESLFGNPIVVGAPRQLVHSLEDSEGEKKYENGSDSESESEGEVE